VEASTLEQLAEKHHRGERLPLRDARPDLPPAFIQVMERALAADPAARFASAGAMEAALAAAQEQGSGAALPVPAVPHRSRRIWLPIGALVLLVVATALAMRMLGGSGGERRSALPSQPVEPQPGSSPSAPGALAPGAPTAALTPPRARPPAVEAALFRIAGGAVEPLASGASVRPGDRLYLELEAREPIHLYVINEDQAGRAYSLFPLNGVEPANPLAANLSHRLPGRRGGAPLEWQVTSAGGREAFLLVASRSRLEALERELGRLEPAEAGREVAYAELDDAALESLRGIGGLVTGRDPGSAGSRGRVAELARRLAASTSGELWVRLFELENPSP
jgi:hypothetical protein